MHQIQQCFQILLLKDKWKTNHNFQQTYTTYRPLVQTFPDIEYEQTFPDTECEQILSSEALNETMETKTCHKIAFCYNI